jgi:TRAP-type transport system small permease protein
VGTHRATGRDGRIILVNVALRYLTNHSIEWAEEVSCHLMILLTFLGAGPVPRR